MLQMRILPARTDDVKERLSQHDKIELKRRMALIVEEYNSASKIIVLLSLALIH